MIGLFSGRRARIAQARKFHEALIEQSRQPYFYARLGVPDTMLGRYEMVCLHAFLVLSRLQREGEEGRKLAQALYNLIFEDFDIALREVGIGDMGIGKRIKKLARNLHGRISAYESGLAAGEAELAAALRRNMYASAEPAPDNEQVAGMIAYLRAARRAIDSSSPDAFFAAELPFPAPETAA